jgi:hypothetical protein
MSQKRMFVSDYVSDHDPAEYFEMLRVFRQELLAHYELPKDLPRQILTLVSALNGQDERLERWRSMALSVAQQRQPMPAIEEPWPAASCR